MVTLVVLPVSADAYSNGGNWFIDIPISQPNCTDDFAYIEVFTHSTEKGFSVDTYLIHAVKDLGSTIQTQNPTLVTTVNGRKLTFTTGTGSYYVEIFCVNQVGTLWNIGSTQGSGTVSTIYSAPSNIACIKYYGFAVNDASSVINNITNISAVYGNDINSVQYLYEILLAIQSQSNNEQANADKNASDIQQNQNDNTDKQIQADKDLYEQEKNEVSTSGNSAIDDSMNVIPDYDLIGSIKTFVNSFTSTSTDCSFECPEIYIPAFSVVPKTVLYEGGTINISSLFDMIPQKILLTVRYLLTAGLIFYCFKEVYDLVFNAVGGMNAIGGAVD